MESLDAQGTAQLNHAFALFDARKTAAVLDVFAANGAGGRLIAKTYSVFHAHNNNQENEFAGRLFIFQIISLPHGGETA